MSNATTTAATLISRFPNRWALFPVGLLGILISVQAVLFSMSRSDPSFAVEPEYYQKAVDWDKEMQQRATNADLGWQTSVRIVAAGDASELQISLLDKQHVPVVGAAITASAFPNARAAQIQTPTLRERDAGVYAGPVALVFPGEWEIRLKAVKGGDTFTHVARASVAPSR